MQHAVARYRQADRAGFSARETERAAFSAVIRALEDPDPSARIAALGRNHALWSALVKDLSLDGNLMPAPLKEQLIGLGMWSMAASTRALSGQGNVAALIEVNRNVLDGLSAQAAGPAAETTVIGDLRA